MSCGCVAASFCVDLVLSVIAPLKEEEADRFAAHLLVCPQFVVSCFFFFFFFLEVRGGGAVIFDMFHCFYMHQQTFFVEE